MLNKLTMDLHLTAIINDKIDSIAYSMDTSSYNTPSLMAGKAGDLLFWAYYLKLKNDTPCNPKITSLLTEVFDEINKGFRYPTYCNGLAGIGWTVEHLVQKNFIKADTNKIIGSLDDFLYPYMMNYIKEGNYDYLHGALGIGLYYLSRESNPKNRKYLENLVFELNKQSIMTDSGITWESSITGYAGLKGFNLSLSHGLASIIVILGRLYEAGICNEIVIHLLSGSISYLLSKKRNDTSLLFPSWICEANIKEKDYGRLAWCYNDMGISIALWQVGDLLQNEEWKAEAINILLNTTKLKSLKEAGVIDTGFCHGAIGIAHIYNRMFKYTKIEAFKFASIYWFEQSIKMATFKDGLAGYKAYRNPANGGWHNEYGLLEGVSGIGLAMISAVSNIDPQWDRALLLS